MKGKIDDEEFPPLDADEFLPDIDDNVVGQNQNEIEIELDLDENDIDLQR